jgi:mono/diheme cytochrome c family protein
VLAVAVFVVIFVGLGLGVFFLASRGGESSARAAARHQSRGGNRLIGITFAVMALGFGVVLPLVLLTGNHSRANAQIGGIKMTAAEKSGRELFGVHCAVCHTLAAANAVGKVGPNLDTLKPAESIVLHTINNGCLPNASASSGQACLGNGVMPAAVVQGRAAQNVAAFVAKVAGSE